MNGRYRKLDDGTWGIQTAEQRQPGDVITIVTKAGQLKRETIDAEYRVDGFGYTYTVVKTERAPVATTAIGDLAGILALFAKAKRALKAPAIELGVPGFAPIRVNVAGAQAKCPGSLTVLSAESFDRGGAYSERNWYGRITLDGVFQPSRDIEGPFRDAVAARLRAFAAEPSKVGGEDGRLHGRCCFCRKALSDERSTVLGYGRKCAQNWDLPWGGEKFSFQAEAVEAVS